MWTKYIKEGILKVPKCKPINLHSFFVSSQKSRHCIFISLTSKNCRNSRTKCFTLSLVALYEIYPIILKFPSLSRYFFQSPDLFASSATGRKKKSINCPSQGGKARDSLYIGKLREPNLTEAIWPCQPLALQAIQFLVNKLNWSLITIMLNLNWSLIKKNINDLNVEP